jgi:transposase InsO family protein
LTSLNLTTLRARGRLDEEQTAQLYAWFCYLATFQDKYTRRVVGWQVSENMTAQLVIDAFNLARRRGLIKRGAIIHTDRGSQFASAEYRRLLYIHGFRQSMSAKGNCYDNAQRDQFLFQIQGGTCRGRSFRVSRTS